MVVYYGLANAIAILYHANTIPYVVNILFMQEQRGLEDMMRGLSSLTGCVGGSDCRELEFELRGLWAEEGLASTSHALVRPDRWGLVGSWVDWCGSELAAGGPRHRRPQELGGLGSLQGVWGLSGPRAETHTLCYG